MIPVIETERLISREYRLEDFPSHAAIWAHSRTTRNIGGDATQFDEELCSLRFLRNPGQWKFFGYGYWGLEDKASGAYMGAVGFYQARRTMDIPYLDAPETGWVLAPDFPGRGLALEALRAAMAWGDANIAASQSWCMIAPSNLISQKLAERVGYRRAADAQHKGQPRLTYLRARAAAIE